MRRASTAFAASTLSSVPTSEVSAVAAVVLNSNSPAGSTTVARNAGGAVAGGAGSALAIATRVLRHEGVAGFYLGLLPVLARNLLIDVIQWSAADAIRQRAARRRWPFSVILGWRI